MESALRQKFNDKITDGAIAKWTTELHNVGKQKGKGNANRLPRMAVLGNRKSSKHKQLDHDCN